jgi:class 3 adenylate cyclase
VLAKHHQAVRRELALYGGVEIDTAGDGFFCRFDGPARAIVCAQRIVDGARELDLEVRAGGHTGECEIVGAKIAGIAVATGARISALAAPGEVLVSRTVKDLVAGSGIEFEDRGEQTLKEYRKRGISTPRKAPQRWPAQATRSRRMCAS